MKQSFRTDKYSLDQKFLLSYLADYAGILTSFICLIHCWIMPLLLIFIPGLLLHNEFIHPVLCSIAMLSTVPIVADKTFKQQSVFYKSVLIIGNFIMLSIILLHDHLHFIEDLMLNTVGGSCLAYLHYMRIRKK